jgi:intergrase/recombinase
MAPRPPGKTSEENAIVERTVRRLYGRTRTDKHVQENAEAFVSYLVKSGIRDEDELVELARIANGKRYDPNNGSFL